jgi:hypothetical protein
MVPRASGPVFIFCASGLIFSGIEGVRSRFHVFRSRTCFRRYQGRQVLFSCFALPESFSAVPWVSDLIFTFYIPELVFDGTRGVRSHFHVLRTQTRFQLYQGHSVPISCFAHQDSFSAVPRASGPVFMFCAPTLVFDGSKGVGSRFHVLRPRSHFRRYRGRKVPFSFFALPDSFSAVPRVSGPIFMFYAPGLVFGSTVSVPYRFHVLRARTRFRRYRGRRVMFSCFARLDSFSVLPRASGPIFLFCAPELIFGCNEGVGSHFHVLRSRTHFRRYRGRPFPF